MPEALKILSDVGKEIGPFTVQEFMEALLPATQKFAAIQKQGRELEIWYLAVLISETIRQSRLTHYCLLDYQHKKAACVGERG